MAHILAVDDSRSMRQMVTFTLQAAGHQITEAEDGQQAYDIAQTGQFDLVLADVNMPRMDGISLVKKLRELPAFKFTPILMLTTEAGSDKKTEGRSAGATGWIVKPFNPDQLLSTISRVLG
nr:response regulator [Oceanococcus sp. HetDA_MAG_MS8]